MTAIESFGLTLRQQRERRGLTLDAIAKSTRIGSNLLASLERGDVTRWPGGIYRRAFVRAYAAAIGLPPEPTLREFVRLCPEPGQDPPALAEDDDPRRLRLTLVAEPRWKMPALRLTAALFDAAVIFAVAEAVAPLTGVGFWQVAAVAGIAYHATGALLLGRSVGASLVASASTVRQSETIRDQFADFRHDWTPALLDEKVVG